MTACVKQVGAKLVTDHQKLDKDLPAIATKGGMTLPAAPAPGQQQALRGVSEKAGTAGYDPAWLPTRKPPTRRPWP
ncbi:DUF4142 domain-containing protein [Streptomyces sp. NBC_00667]|uniref:DUF4142 domain-containing protein n=1 Tax=unclassified Streptomyces TaxID=2593676 RepID=UPI003FA70CF7